MRLLVAVLFVLAAAASGERVSYRGYKVYAVTAVTEKQVNLLLSLERSERYDFWTHIIKDDGKAVADIMVAPQEQSFFEYLMGAEGIKYEVMIWDVQEDIDNEAAAQMLAKASRIGSISFKSYYRSSEMDAYLDRLAQKYPEVVTIESYGKSFMGKDLRAIKISTGGNGKRPLILVDAGVHAREWIAPAMALYIINQIVENPKYAFMTKNVDWLIVPLVNPDGYEYTHTNNRLWRKTRSTSSSSPSCLGVDGNRNWDWHFAEVGASNSPCSETYHGPEAFSEPETRFLAELAGKYAARTKFYLSFHSYGQYILYPFSYTEKLPADNDLLMEVGQIGHSAIKAVRGTHYTVGNTVHVMYAAAGGSHDYMKGKLGIELSYTLELPGGGFVGFDLPPSKIESVVTETFEAVVAWHNYVEEHH